MAIIDSSSTSKFDVLIRTSKADTLMAFVMATYKVENSANKKNEIAYRLKSAYELYRKSIRGLSGAGTYGQDDKKVVSQFESHYTMGYEMGIWENNQFELNSLAKMVAEYKITVSDYIGVVFLNLFSYYNVDGEEKYHHFLYEFLKKADEMGILKGAIPKELLLSMASVNKLSEQRNTLFNYLGDSDLFERIDKNNLRLSDKWIGNPQGLISMCNLEYQSIKREAAVSMAKDKKQYADYVTKRSCQDDVHLTIQECEKSRKNLNNVGDNTLLYGVPGCGKSHYVENVIGVTKENSKRVVFHPDYTHSDFIGQILPFVKSEMEILLETQDGKDYVAKLELSERSKLKNDKNISYKFTPGPFTEILAECQVETGKMHYLVIEEINRGNAPAIFGEVFQLLDRNDSGLSEYGVHNADMANAISEILVKKEVVAPKEIELGIIKIPSNLTIVATMNTADQNVFTLDTAFKRRWKMKAIRNSFDINKLNQYDGLSEKVKDKMITGLKNQLETNLCSSTITWQEFATEVNTKIVEVTGNEDKRLGHFFIKGEEMINKQQFSEKVIMYLWNDVFKYGDKELFKYNTLDELLDKFEVEEFGVFNIRFNEDIKKSETDTESILDENTPVEIPDDQVSSVGVVADDEPTSEGENNGDAE